MARGKVQSTGAAFLLLRCALVGCCASVALMLIFAALIWKQVIDIEAIPLINALIKVAGAALAGILAKRGRPNRAWLWGALAGAAYAGLAYAVFAALSGSFAFNLAMFSDIAIGLAGGMLAAMIMAAAGK